MIKTGLNKSDYLLLFVYFILFVLVETYDHTFHFNKTNYTFIQPDGTSYSQMNTSPSLMGYIIGIPVSLISALSIIIIFYKSLIPTYLINSKKYLQFSVLGMIVLLVFGALRFTVWHWAENAPWQTYPPFFDLFFNSISNGASNAGFPLGILLTKKYFEAQTQIAFAQKKQKESELKLLQAQLNPHFLFNNLNTLDALIDTKPDQAKEYIVHLSALYRYLISTKDKEIVLLKEELSMIKNYFYLIKTRFGDIYSFNIEGNSEATNPYLPVGALQVLIENVVKHNSVPIGRSIRTTITVEDQQITVTNNKTGSSEETDSFGTGLDNLHERYALLSDKNIQIHNSNTEFKVSLPIIELIT